MLCIWNRYFFSEKICGAKFGGGKIAVVAKGALLGL
jgi:hypothetical protein